MTSVSLARNAMATRFEIVLHGECAVALRAAGEAALNEIERAEAQVSLYRPTRRSPTSMSAPHTNPCGLRLACLLSCNTPNGFQTKPAACLTLP